jgi:hypothetical protein
VATGVKVYDGDKAEWVSADKETAAHHEAIAEGKPLPSDRTEAELRELESGGVISPVVTADENRVLVSEAAPRAAGAGRGATP